MADNIGKRWAWIMGLRALLMLVAGIFAVLMPGYALTVLVTIGGALILVDGILGLWSLTFGGAKTGNFWFDVVRNALAIILGILILISPLMATLLTATFLIYLIAFQAIVIGIMEVVMVFRSGGQVAETWPILLSGLVYVLFGIAAVFWPLLTAVTAVIFIGVLMIVFAIGLFALAFRLYRAASG
jgi:uncharacterized membrane protein HdeD (DUF308 family)